MNFYLLVEGDHDEPIVYSAWLKQCCPHMSQVKQLADVKENQFLIFQGGGYPSVIRRIRNSLGEIATHSKIDRFFLCVDAEHPPFEERLAHYNEIVRQSVMEAEIERLIPGFRAHVIMQNICLETWFLGNVAVLESASTSAQVSLLKGHYDVGTRDPESMPQPTPSSFATTALFHNYYLRQVLRTQKKSFPNVAKDEAYTQALRHRCAETGHLRSLHRLFDILDHP